LLAPWVSIKRIRTLRLRRAARTRRIMRRLVSYPKYGTSPCLRASPLSKRRISVRSFSARERSRRSLITRRSSHLLWSLISKERVDSTKASTRTIKKLMISISISVTPPPKTRRNRMQPTKRARTRIRRFLQLILRP
jgi:hypothetical protein